MLIEYVSEFNSKFNLYLENYLHQSKEFKPFTSYALEGGARVRPLLAVIGFNLFSPGFTTPEDLLGLCLSLELLHKASLILDDLLDSDLLRRGKPTFSKKFGEQMAVVFTYYLISESLKTFEEMKKDQSFNLVKLYNEIINSLSTGILLELNMNSYFSSLKESLRINKLQNTIFIKNSILLGANFSKRLSKEDILLVEEIGKNIGFIFSTINDLNVFLKSDNEIKIKGSKFGDILQKRNNIIISCFLEKLDELGYEDFKNKIRFKSLTEKDINEIIQLLFEYGVINKFKELISLKQTNTLDLLSNFTLTPAVEILIKILTNYNSDSYWMSSILDLNFLT